MWNLLAGLGMSLFTQEHKYAQANLQYEIDEATRIHNNKQAVSALMSTWRSIEFEEDQVAENAVASSIDAQKAAAQLKGTILAEAGASGVGGSGASMQARDVTTEASRNMARASINRERELRSLEMQTQTALATANQRVNLMPGQKPSMWNYGINAIGQGFQNSQAIGSFQEAWEQWQ